MDLTYINKCLYLFFFVFVSLIIFGLYLWVIFDPNSFICLNFPFHIVSHILISSSVYSSLLVYVCLMLVHIFWSDLNTQQEIDFPVSRYSYSYILGNWEICVNICNFFCTFSLWRKNNQFDLNIVPYENRAPWAMQIHRQIRNTLFLILTFKMVNPIKQIFWYYWGYILTIIPLIWNVN